MDRSEKFVNSGWFVLKAYLNELPGSPETFSVKIEKSRTFSYDCILHTWMSGQIVVTE